jgi:hypothetical protein
MYLARTLCTTSWLWGASQVRSAGTAINLCDTFKGFFNVFAAARPGGLLADIASNF